LLRQNIYDLPYKPGHKKHINIRKWWLDLSN
jgi:hypothetical protein